MAMATIVLLSPPNCPHGHGPMVPIEGEWALHEVRRTEAAEGQRGHGVFTGRLYAFDLYRCMTCGLVQLYDRTDL